LRCEEANQSSRSDPADGHGVRRHHGI